MSEIHILRGNGKIETHKVGWLREKRDLTNSEKRYFIDLFLGKGEEVELFFKSRNFSNYPVSATPFLFAPSLLSFWRMRNVAVQCLFQGMIWIMILYNLFNFFSSEDRSYLYYVLYLVAGSIYFLHLYGYTLQHLTGNFPKSETYIWLLSTYASTLFYALFTRKYFNTKKTVPSADKIILNWIRFELLILAVLVAILVFTFDTWLIRTINVGVLLLGVGVSIAVLWKLRVLKSRIYYLFLIGASTYLFSVTFFFYGLTFASWGWVQGISTRVMTYVVEAGLVTEVLCFSIGLNYRMRQSEESKREVQSKLISQLETNQTLQDEINRNLELKVKERTLEIENQSSEIEIQRKQLEKQNEKLQELNEEKNHLMGVLAHDLRNPMTSLLTIANLLKSESDQLQPDHVEYTNHMIGTLDRMNQMITRTLDIKASEAKDLQINWQAVNLAKVVGKVAGDFQDRANQKEIELRLELEDSHVEVDTNYTEQVVENLISNALKFSPKGKTIYIKVTKSESKAKIEIIDEGPGIHESEMEKLFGKYQKLSAQPTDGEKSTGLGLSIVKKYVEAMRGCVWCESELNKGANFMVEFEVISLE